MSDNTGNRRENDARQSGENDPAYGQDARDFGAGGQTTSQPMQGHDENRDADRDPTLRPAQQGASEDGADTDGAGTRGMVDDSGAGDRKPRTGDR